MAAIARRALLALFFAPAEAELRSVLASMAADLSEGNVSAFLSAFSKSFPARDELRLELTGLTAAYDLNSSVQIQSADDTSLKADWYLAGRARSDNAIAFQRREVLSITFRQEGKSWRIVELTPINIFQTPR